MSSFTSTLATLVIGIVATIWASWYYFRKSQDKRLAVDVQFATSVLRGIDPQVRSELQVSYRGKSIEDMVHMQFLVVNQGQRAIRDVIEPLTVTLPSTVRVLDAAIVHVHPEGRAVAIEATAQPDGTSVLRLPFQLLNRGEGFMVRLLLTGALEAKHLRFTIVSDDLPPILSPTGWGVSTYGTTPRASPVGILAPLGIMACGVAVLSVTANFVATHPAAWPVPWDSFHPTLVDTGAIVLAGLVGLTVVLLGVVAMVAQDGRPFSNPRPTLPLPPHLKQPAWIRRDEFGSVPESHAAHDKSNRLV